VAGKKTELRLGDLLPTKENTSIKLSFAT